MDILKPLLISKVRVKLLQLFLSEPDQMYYVRQLVRITEEEINAVRRELGNLESANFLIKEKRGNRLYYYFNTKHLLYEDLLSIVSKTTGLGDRIIKLRNKIGRIKFVIFSSHFVRRFPYDPDRVDVIVVGEVVLPEISALIKEEEARLSREINYTVMDQEEFKFRRSKRDPFLQTLLMSPRVMIIGSQLDLID